MAFEYRDSNLPIRNDLIEANRRAWENIASPGSWWSGAERVPLAAEVRAAARCALCAERKAALSPFAVQGDHDGVSALPAAAVDLVHRLTTDPGRLSRQWYDDTIAAGLTPERYVEIVAKGPEADLYAGLPASNVTAAMSLVPDCVRELKSLSGAYYLDDSQITDLSTTRGKLTRVQIEFVAGRVSALNECFY